MVLVGRVTKDAGVSTLKDERKVVNFSIAINDYYKAKGQAEPQKFTTYVSCAYWISIKVAERLKKGTLVEISGRLFVTAYADMDGNAKASLNCHVNSIKIHSAFKEVAGVTVPLNSNSENTDDLPF